MAKKLPAIKEAFTWAQTIGEIANATGLTRKDIKNVFDELSDIAHRHLKPKGCGEFKVKNLFKATVAKKPATKARQGINPFTGEEMTFKAKPASRKVKIRALKGVKDML